MENNGLNKKINKVLSEMNLRNTGKHKTLTTKP